MTNLLALSAGTELAGDFKIKRVIGAGGFGITYLAEELALARQVTIKEYFPSDFAARKGGNDAGPRSKDCASDYKWGLDRFIEEAQTLARFNHPNIVRVYRYFRANSTGYMVLHFEEGANFKAWLKALGRAPRQAELDLIVEPLLDALDVIHKGDFLHRDIAPDNIIVRKDKTPVLIDFGSARGDIASHSRTVSALVKPGYSPYEQYASTSRQQGPWTDIYALGATFYQAITGKRPPDAPSRMVHDDYVVAKNAALGSYRAGFLAAIDQALQLDVTARPQSIAEWRRALLAPEPKPVAKTSRARIGDVLGLNKAEPKPEIKAAAMAVLPVPPDAPQPKGQLLDFIDGLKDSKAGPANKIAAKAEATPVAKGTQRASVADGVGGQVAKGSAAQAGGPNLQVDGPNQMPHGLGYGPAPVGALTQRLQEVKVAPVVSVSPVLPKVAVVAVEKVAAQAPSPAIAEKAAPPRANAVVVVPRPVERRDPYRPKRRWFFLRQPWRSFIFKAAVAVAVASALVAYQDRLPQLATQGVQRVSSQSLPVARGDNAAPRVEVMPLVLPSGQPLTGHVGAVSFVQFAAQGRRIVSTGADATIRVWDSASAQAVKTLRSTDGVATSLAVYENLALTGHGDGTMVLWDLEAGQRLGSVKRSTDAITGVAFGADGEKLIAGSSDGKITLWYRQSNAAPQIVVDAHEASILSLQRVAGRSAIVSIGADRVVRMSKTETLSSVRSYRGAQAALTALDVSGDGRSIMGASGDGLIRLWSSSSSRLIKSFKAHDGAIAAVGFAPNGAVVVSAGVGGDVKVWDGKRGKLLASFVAGHGQLRAVGFAQDGRRIVTAGDDGNVRLWDSAQIRITRD
ncbi:MAG: protein kinase [Hyphomicrobiaceae bacterium]|nr:protein kinase [Hyphomicrobiaceae bacterium]